MSSELKRESIKTGKKLKEASFEQRLDMDITLPDYCADIKKILRCTVMPAVHTVSLSGERASAKGTGTVRVIYLAEGDKTDAFEKSVELSSSANMGEALPESTVIAECAVDFVNCRAVSQRKISIGASVSTIFTLYGCEEGFYALPDEEGSIQVKREKLTFENHLGFFEKTFDLSETASLAGEHPPVGKIIGCSCRILNISSKLSGGKLLIKGDAVTDICYIPEKSENTFHSLSHSMPVSQIVDVRDIPDGADCSVKLRCCQLLCSAKADSSGSSRLVDVSLRVSAFVHLTEKKECEVITDCYCTKYEISESFDFSDFLCPVREISEARQIKGAVELSSPVREICFARCLEISKSVKYTEDKIQLDCSALVLVMYIDDKGTPCIAEKNLDFDFSYSVVRKCKEPFGSFELEPLSLSASAGAGGKAELILDYFVSGKAYCSCERKILKQLSILEDKPKKNDGAALAVYFTDKGESLWDIARSHNTTVTLIREENALKDESVKENTMLIIPCG